MGANPTDENACRSEGRRDGQQTDGEGSEGEQDWVPVVEDGTGDGWK